MTEFEARLSECLEALREGRSDVDECLRRYPEHADALRPHLLAAASVMQAYGGTAPSGDFARRARERFLIASGQRLQEALDAEPEPSFFAAARMRFLLAAQRMRFAEPRRAGRLLPFFETHFRAVSSAAAVLLLMLSFSTYTVASAANALPGDWQYPVKLQTERVRLVFAFSESSKRDVKLDRVEERAREIQELTKRGRIIGPGVIDRLVEQTKPLVDDAGNEWNSEDLARLESVAEHEQLALKQAKEQVHPDAQDELAAAQDLSQQAIARSSEILAGRPTAPPRVVTPSVLLDASETATPESPTASPTDASATEGASPTPGDATPGAAPTSEGPGTVSVGETPVLTRGGVTWIRLAAGRFTTLIPSIEDGWTITGIDVADGPKVAPSLIKLSNVNGTSLITLNIRTGDMYWFIARNGRFDEVQMRLKRADGEIVVVDRDFVQQIYGDAAKIPLYVLDNIELEPEPTPTPSPADTPTP